MAVNPPHYQQSRVFAPILRIRCGFNRMKYYRYGILLSIMGMKNFLARKMLERQLKNLPEEQRGIFLKMFETDPDFL